MRMIDSRNQEWHRQQCEERWRHIVVRVPSSSDASRRSTRTIVELCPAMATSFARHRTCRSRCPSDGLARRSEVGTLRSTSGKVIEMTLLTTTETSASAKSGGETTAARVECVLDLCDAGGLSPRRLVNLASKRFKSPRWPGAVAEPNCQSGWLGEVL
jgi:hypothetical protein